MSIEFPNPSDLPKSITNPVWALDWTNQPLHIDPLTMHTVVSGATRSGKTVGTYGILSQLSRIPYLRIIGIDPSSVLLGPLAETRPQDFALGSSPDTLEKSLEILQHLEQEMDRRTSSLLDLRTDKLNPTHLTPEHPAVLLVLEEYAGFLAALEGMDKKKKTEATRIIGRILREGAKTLVHVLTIIQRPEAAILHDRAQYSRRISFRLDNDDGVKMLFEGASDESRAAVKEFQPGQGLIHEAGTNLRKFNTAYLEYPDYLDRLTTNHPPLLPERS